MSNETKPPVEMEGQTISHYRLLEKLGEGGMGIVYRALDHRLDRQVALKLLLPKATLSPDSKRRFMQEAKVTSALNHPNIVTIYEIDNSQGLDFISMEYVRGKTLSLLLRNRGLRTSEVLRYAVQISDALAAAHAGGVVHRDIKPANIMIADAGDSTKVLDFGLAKLTETAESGDLVSTQTMDREVEPQTASGKVLGTVAYMSPEQAGGKKVDSRSDIFSFGSLLYEMLTGQRAFQGETKMSVLAAILHEQPKALRELVRDVPLELEEVIDLCLRKEPSKRLQSMADVKILLESLREKCDAGKLGQMPRAVDRRRSNWWRNATVSLLMLGAAAGTWWLARPGESASAVRLSRLTWDSGLTVDPTLSPNGQLLAYASDRYGEGNLDIWVQPLGGGEPSRLTQNPADEEWPSFSPDSSRIVFRSARRGGGLYVISALGGQERLIANGGQNPSFSPDGTQILYWVGEPANFAPSGKIYAVPATGGKSVQIEPGFADARYPIWTPDGGHVLFQGIRSAQEPPDWWVAPASPGIQVNQGAVKTGAFDVFGRKGISVYMGPGGFRGDHIVFSANEADSRSVYEIPISTRNWRAANRLRRLTFGTGLDAQPSPSAGGQVVFASLNFSNNIWLLPIDTQGQLGAEPQRVTEGTAYDATPSCSRDGAKLVFTSGRLGNRDVWIKDLKSGREAALTVTPVNEFSPVISADGSKVAYTVSGQTLQPIYIVDTRLPPGSSVPERICDDCGEPFDWTLDRSGILYGYGRPKAVGSFRIATGRKTPLVHSARYDIDQAQFSPDGAWISVMAYTDPSHTRIFVIPLHDGTAASEDRWIPITDGESWDDRPRWSPHGDFIYFYSRRDGFGCIWKQALDQATRRPVGAPSAVHHFHSSRLSIMHMAFNRLGICAVADKLIFNLLETTGNIWMMQPNQNKN